MIQLKNYRSKIALSLRHPQLLLEYIITSHNFSKSRHVRVKAAAIKYSMALSQVLECKSETVKEFFNELLSSGLINQLINRGLRNVKAGISVGKGAILYVVTRILKPKWSLEAGVGAGVSLHDNNFGNLISIELRYWLHNSS
ncbi:MAG: hypothetical protein QW096_12885 [Thermofilaceae archaeon]